MSNADATPTPAPKPAPASDPRDQRAFRGLLGRFATGVTIVTARMPDGEPLGVTMNSFSSVSMDPPLVLFSVGHKLQSLEGLRNAAGFAIHILGRKQHELAMRFGRQDKEKWNGVAHHDGFGGAPILDDALAHFECKPYACYPGGDHDIFVVEVVSQSDRNGGGEPLIFYSGGLRGLGSELPHTTEDHLAYYFF